MPSLSSFLPVQSTAPTGSERGMQRLTQFVTMSFSDARSGRCHEQTPHSATSLPISTSGCPHSSNIAASSMLLVSPRVSVDYESTEEPRGHERDVAIQGFSTGSRAPDDIVVADRGHHFRSHLTAFSNGRSIQNTTYLR